MAENSAPVDDAPAATEAAKDQEAPATIIEETKETQNMAAPAEPTDPAETTNAAQEDDRMASSQSLNLADLGASDGPAAAAPQEE